MLFPTYNRVAILSSGRYGCELAVQFANIGMPVLLFDLASDHDDPCYQINANIDELYRTSAGIFSRRNYRHYISAKTYQHHVKELSNCDLVLCAINDVVVHKQGLWLRLAPFFHANTALVTMTNTHGLEVLAKGLPENLRQQLCGCHWMQPLRAHEYIGISHLPQTLPQTVDRVSLFFERVVGKTVYAIADSPLNIIQDFACFWLSNCQEILSTNRLSVKWLDDWLVDTYDPALTTQQIITSFGYDRITHFIDRQGNEELNSFVKDCYEHKLSGNQGGSVKDTDSFKLAVDRYMKQKAEELELDASIYASFVADFFLFKPQVLLNTPKDSSETKKTISPKLKSIYSKWPEWLHAVSHSYGTVIEISDFEDTEMSLKQLQALEDLCISRLAKMDPNDQSLVIQFNDYSPTKLPANLYHKVQTDMLRPDKCEEWALAWVRICRLLFDRSVPTITVLSGYCSGFAAVSAMYSSNTVVHENLKLLPVCFEDKAEKRPLPVPGYHYALKERLAWQREKKLDDDDAVLDIPTPADITWGAIDAKQKGWVGRNALIVSNMSELSEVIPHYMQMNSHTFTWSASLPRTPVIDENHPWYQDLKHFK